MDNEKPAPNDPGAGSRETACPGWATGACITCRCPGSASAQPVAAKGELFAGVVFPWEAAHPEDVREERRRRARWQAEDEKRREAGGPRKGYVLAALRGEARNIVDDGRHNHQINVSAYKLRQKYIATGDLTETEVAQTIYEAAWERGYHRQIVATIASALGISRADVERMVIQ